MEMPCSPAGFAKASLVCAVITRLRVWGLWGAFSIPWPGKLTGSIVWGVAQRLWMQGFQVQTWSCLV